MKFTKFYDCLITPLQFAFEEIFHNMTQGYTKIGNNLLTYVFDRDNIGCFRDPLAMCDLVPLFTHLDTNSSNDSYIFSKQEVIKQFCVNSQMPITGLIKDAVTQASHLVQGFIIDGRNVSIDTLTNTTSILGVNYTIKNNHFYLSTGERSFWGLNSGNCSKENVIHFINKYLHEHGVNNHSLEHELKVASIVVGVITFGGIAALLSYVTHKACVYYRNEKKYANPDDAGPWYDPDQDVELSTLTQKVAHEEGTHSEITGLTLQVYEQA